MHTDRRSVLKALAAAGILPSSVLRPSPAAAGISFKSDPFALGIASGAPSANGIVLWTRLAGDGLPQSAITVSWEVLDDQGRRIVARGTEQALPELGHSVHADVTGLEPGRWYQYRFTSGTAESGRGYTRTLPAPGSRAERLRIAFASCQRWDHGRFWAYQHMAEEQPDLVLFLGDYIYENLVSPADPRNAKPQLLATLKHAHTLEEYRSIYETYRTDADLKGMHAACPWLVTWDDHEVVNDYAGDITLWGPEETFKRLVAGYRAYYEHMPLSPKAMYAGFAALKSWGALRVHERYDFGGLARIHVLDARQYRSPPRCPAKADAAATSVTSEGASCVLDESGKRSFLGMEQEAWLEDGVRSGRDMAWNVIGQPTRVTTAWYKKGLNAQNSPDTWEGFPAARQRLIDMINDNARGRTLLIGGDIHSNWIADVHANPYDIASPVVAAEFCGTSISSLGYSNETLQKIAANNPHCKLANSQLRGYGILDLTPRRAEVTLRTVDARASAVPAKDTLAVFEVTNGDGRIAAVQRQKGK